MNYIYSYRIAGKGGKKLKLAFWHLDSTLPKLNHQMHFVDLELHQTAMYCQTSINQPFKWRFLTILTNMMTTIFFSHMVHTLAAH